MNKYPCSMINGLCEYGGNKRYNYGFVSGTASFCRFPKVDKWVSDLDLCPKDIQDERGNEPPQKVIKI